MARRLAAILAADVAGYSKLMFEDEAGTLTLLKAHRAELFDPEITSRGGRIVKLMGDGVLVEFPSAIDALEAALSIQNKLAEEDSKITLRIGINLGDVIVDGDDIYGDGVNVAARLEAFADPGCICISGTAHDIVAGKVRCEFEDCGLQMLKNITKPIRIYRIRHGDNSGRDIRKPAPETSSKMSIAVLPFANMSGDVEQEYFSDGITEDIITDLSKLSQLFVIARASTFSYKARAVNARQISNDLDAKYLVEGSVRKAGNRVRVTAQLIDGQTGGHIWAERYDRELTDVFEVQDDIAKNIVDALKIAIAPKERHAIEKVPTRNIEAYDKYIRGRQLLHEMTKENLEQARRMFLEAVELDPEYTIALTGLADCDSVYYSYYSSDRGFIDEALANSEKALRLDPTLAEAHASMGLALSYCDDRVAVEREFKTAINLDPMLYEAYWHFGIEKVLRGDFETAARLFSQASSVRGDDLQSKMMLMTAYLGLRRDSDMQSLARETLSIATRRLELNPRDYRAAYIGANAIIHLGDKTQALEWLKIAAGDETNDSRTTYNLACSYSLLDESEAALEFLELSIRAGRPVRMLEWARIDPDLKSVRADPRFEKLMENWQEIARPDAPSETQIQV